MFHDRLHAGRLLVEQLAALPASLRADVVIGLARGGIVVARSIADGMGIPCDILVVKKISSPTSPELALGAVAASGVVILHEERIRALGVNREYLQTQIVKLNDLVQQKTALYRKGRKQLQVSGKRVILADDGMATGATMEAAVAWCKKHKVNHLTVALPVAPYEGLHNIRGMADEVVVLDAPEHFDSVGRAYEHFEQVEDDEVIALLQVRL